MEKNFRKSNQMKSDEEEEEGNNNNRENIKLHFACQTIIIRQTTATWQEK